MSEEEQKEIDRRIGCLEDIVSETRNDIVVIKTDIAVIKTSIGNSMDSIKQHIERGTAWRIGILGVAALLIIDMIIIGNMWGRLTRTVEVHSEKIVCLEEIHPREK